MTDWRDEARNRCDAATKGPWVPSGLVLNGINLVGRVATVAAKFGSQEATLLFVPMGSRDLEYRGAIADKEFVAHARTDLPRALAELDKAHARIAELERQLAADDAMLLHLDRAAPETSAWLFDAGLDIDNFRAALKRAAIAKAESKP